MAFDPQPFNGSFKGKDIVSAEQFTSKEEINFLFKIANRMKKSVEARELRTDLRGFCIAELFYQPSTRTFTSFFAAAQRLGVSYFIPIHEMAAYSSAVKGESLPDTIRTIEQTTASDLIILRHPENASSEKAAFWAKVPIINAGSGTKEHPTQAILDLYTIKEELGRLDRLRVVMLGDLKNGRTIKSLVKLLSVVAPSTEIIFVSPTGLEAPQELIFSLRKKGEKIRETDNPDKVLPIADVLYVTRIQKEWFTDPEEYERVQGSYAITPELMKKAKKDMIVMHPLPRVNEIDQQFDSDPRAVYFRQMRNGLYTRMALLAAVLGKV